MLQIRPVQEKTKNLKYIFTKNLKTSKLNLDLKKARNNYNQVKKLSRDFIESTNFKTSFNSDKLNEISKLLEDQRRNPDLAKLRVELKTIVGPNSNSFTKENITETEINQMWDSLTATTISQQVPEKREELIQSLRTQNFIQALNTDSNILEDDAELLRLLKARPTLASVEEINNLQARRFEKKVRAGRTQSENIDFSRRVSLFNRIKELESANKDLGKVYKLNIKEAGKNVSKNELEQSREIIETLKKETPVNVRTNASSINLNRTVVNRLNVKTLNTLATGNKTNTAILNRTSPNSALVNDLEKEELFLLSSNKTKATVLSSNIQRKLTAKSQTVLKDFDKGADNELELRKTENEIEKRLNLSNKLMMQDLPTKSIIKLTRLRETVKAQSSRFNFDADILKLFRPRVDLSRLNPNKITGSFKVIGIGDLLKIEQELVDYQATEVSHVENILQSENKNRSFRRKTSQEETLFSSETVEEENSYDLQSTKRSQMYNEVQSQIKNENEMSLGISLSAKYGPVKLSTDAKFSSRTSKEQSAKTASDFAKEVTEKSANTISSKVQEERTTKTQTEVEELSSHGFDNSNGSEHIVGIYQWLNKRYKNRVVNYGKRLMLEFMVPEPAAFYKYSKENPVNNIDTTYIPTKPDPIGDLNYSDINRSNYSVLAAKYNAVGIKAAPSHKICVGTSITKDYTSKQEYSVMMNKELKIPDGYQADNAEIDYSAVWSSKDSPSIYLLVGDEKFRNSDGNFILNLKNEVGTLPISLICDLKAVAINIDVECVVREETYQNWQIATYEAIKAAHDKMLNEYEDAMRQAEINTGVQITGNNPDKNRIIEETELKKSCIRILSKDSFENFDAMKDSVSFGYPDFDLEDAEEEGKYVQFMEQGFEWDQMTYINYPYFWGRKTNWLETQSLSDTDPKFEAFLKAGYTKVNIPVRPGYEDAIMYFINSGGEIWNGGEAPVINDPMYVSIAEELSEPEGEQVGEEWETKVATNLVMINKESKLPSFS